MVENKPTCESYLNAIQWNMEKRCVLLNEANNICYIWLCSDQVKSLLYSPWYCVILKDTIPYHSNMIDESKT